MTTDLNHLLTTTIRSVPDWPEIGVNFRDITPIFQNPSVFTAVIDALCERYAEQNVDALAALDARGFLLAGAMAYQMQIPMIPIRKKGKLPYKTICTSYALEYGTGALEMHIDAIQADQRIVLIDDLIATGGTLLAANRLIRQLKGQVIEAAAIIDLPELGGSAALAEAGVNCHHLVQFSGA